MCIYDTYIYKYIYLLYNVDVYVMFPRQNVFVRRGMLLSGYSEMAIKASGQPERPKPFNKGLPERTLQAWRSVSEAQLTAHSCTLNSHVMSLPGLSNFVFGWGSPVSCVISLACKANGKS